MRAARVFIATHTPVLTEYPMLHGLTPCESFVIGARVASGAAPDVLADDDASPYHYYRIVPCTDHDLVLFGGEDRATGAGPDQANPDRYRALEQTLREWLPDVAFDVEFRWLAQEFMSPDALPIIGPDALGDRDHVYVATGFAGVGMTFGTLSGMMCADWVLGRDNRYASLYAPARLQHTSVSAMERHTATHASEQQNDARMGESDAALSRLARGEGMLVRDARGQHIAAYRDDTGHLHRLSAICRHRGCIVRWNAAGRTWDCPCHGSRYECTGAVRAGPTVHPLDQVLNVPGEPPDQVMTV